MTAVSVLFLINRYTMLVLVTLPNIYVSSLATGHLAVGSCASWDRLGEFGEIITVMSTNMLFTMRAYVICSKKRWILAVAGVLTASRVGIDIWRSVSLGSLGLDWPISPNLTWAGLCRWPVFDIQKNIHAEIAIAVLSATFDIFIFALTIVSMYYQVLEKRRLQRPPGVSDIILRDGVEYFFIVFLISVIYLSLEVLSLTIQDTPIIVLCLTEVLSPFFSCMPNLLINRFVLNLRQFGDQHSSSGQSITGDLASQIRFADIDSRFFGNIGATLDYDECDAKLNEPAPIGLEVGVGEGDHDRFTSEEEQTSSGRNHATLDMESGGHGIQVVPRDQTYPDSLKPTQVIESSRSVTDIV